MHNSGIERVIQYVPHSLSSIQRRWATIEKEAYAVVYAISKLQDTFMAPTSQSIPTTSPSLLYSRKKYRTPKFRGGLCCCQSMVLKYNNVRVDMLSRIPPGASIHTIGCDDWVDPTVMPEQHAADVLPLFSISLPNPIQPVIHV